MPRRYWTSLIKILVILDLILLIFWLQGSNIKSQELPIQNPNYPEIQQLTGKNLNFEELKKYFTTLAEKKGAKYAYEVLKTIPVSPNTDMHLLGHVVGDVLYKQEGAQGIKICTEDFRNACSHSIVVGLLLDKGHEEALEEINTACKQAPGGTGAYTMCYHGLGHGILAYKAYQLPEAINLCQRVGQQESAQCISGTIMEMISGGFHDRNLWASKRKEYLLVNDPFYPCAADFMPGSAKHLCYTYLTPYLWEAVGANLGNPTDTDFAKSFALCDQIPDQEYTNTCFGGFGKEFVGLAASRDIRRVDQMNDEQLTTVYQWCQLAKNSDGIKACLEQALSSLYWGGENDRSASIRFCKVISDTENQNNCFLNLIGQVSSYIKDSTYRQSFCEELPVEYIDECKKRLT